jgi:hypothetical protein
MIGSAKMRGILRNSFFVPRAAAALVFVTAFNLQAQDSAKVDSVIPVDTVAFPAKAVSQCGMSGPQLATARVAAGTVFIGTNAMLYRYFKKAWWSGERADHFFFHADWDENFRDQDKFGHLFGGYHLAQWGYALLRNACASPQHALLWSAIYATAFQLQIEIWDAQYKKYGFSYADVLANTTGMVLAVAQRKHPSLRFIKPTMSYHESDAMRNRKNIPGELRPSLDYTGQTYWFSFDIKEILPDNAKPFWPGFLRVSAGHSITDWIDPRTGANIRAKRKILLSLDLELEGLPGNNPVWKTLKRNLSFIHLPSPALQLTPTFEGISWYR